MVKQSMKGESVKIIGCPVCWGKKFVCVGLKDGLEPILKSCSGCDGCGWIAYKEVDKNKVIDCFTMDSKN